MHSQKLYWNTGSKIICNENKDEPRSYDHLRTIDAINAPNGVGTGVIDRNGAIIQYVSEPNNIFYLYVLKDDKLLMKQRVSNFIDQMVLDRHGGLWMAARDKTF